VLRFTVRIASVKQKGCVVVSKRELLKLPYDLEGNLRALLATPPPPAGIPGSRKVKPKPPPKPKKKAKRRRYAKPAATGTYAYESAPVTKKRKAKKR
jgi:hypothetical protein